tara:strand:- start:1509 stop:1679 length:171 start_codon:yes stop_codon:yes gene_type:complete
MVDMGVVVVVVVRLRVGAEDLGSFVVDMVDSAVVMVRAREEVVMGSFDISDIVSEN